VNVTIVSVVRVDTIGLDSVTPILRRRQAIGDIDIGRLLMGLVPIGREPNREHASVLGEEKTQIVAADGKAQYFGGHAQPARRHDLAQWA